MKQCTPSRRARVLRWHAEHGGTVTATCLKFKVSRATFYRWKAQFDPDDPRSIRPQSRRPLRTRQPIWLKHNHAFQRLEALVARHPKYGKRRLTRLLTDEGITVTESSVGRLLHIIWHQPCRDCGRVGGRHNAMIHALRADLRAVGGGPRATL